MPIRTRVEPIDRDISIILADDLSPQARSRTLAAFAAEKFAETDTANRLVLGRVPPHRTYVDGREGSALESVRPDGQIVREYDIVTDALMAIGEELRKASPRKTGRYQASHTLFADDVEVAQGGVIPKADEYVFISSLPYSRKLERKYSIYEDVQRTAARRFGNQARIRFSYLAVSGGRSVRISRIGPLQVKRRKNGRFMKGSHIRAGNAEERELRYPCIVVTLR